MASPARPSEESHGISTTPIGVKPIIPVGAPVPLSPASPTVSISEPTVTVTVPNRSGSVTFSLVVTDNLGVVSAPATFTVNIQPSPVAELTGPESVLAGASIQLSGAGSQSTGSIASYQFSLLPSITTPITPVVNPVSPEKKS